MPTLVEGHHISAFSSNISLRKIVPVGRIPYGLEIYTSHRPSLLRHNKLKKEEVSEPADVVDKPSISEPNPIPVQTKIPEGISQTKSQSEINLLDPSEVEQYVDSCIAEPLIDDGEWKKRAPFICGPHLAFLRLRGEKNKKLRGAGGQEFLQTTQWEEAFRAARVFCNCWGCITCCRRKRNKWLDHLPYLVKTIVVFRIPIDRWKSFAGRLRRLAKEHSIKPD